MFEKYWSTFLNSFFLYLNFRHWIFCRKLLPSSQDGAVEPLGARLGSTWCARTRNRLNASFQIFPFLHTNLNQVGHQVVPKRHLVRPVEAFKNQNALQEIISHNCAVIIFYFLFPTSFTLRYWILCWKLLPASQDGAVEPLGARPGSTWCARTWNGQTASFQISFLSTGRKWIRFLPNWQETVGERSSTAHWRRWRRRRNW